MKKINLIVLALAAAMSLSACGTNGNKTAGTATNRPSTNSASNKAVNDGKNVVDDAGNAVNDAGDVVGNAVKGTGDVVGGAVEGATDVVGDAVEGTGQAIDNSARNM